MGIVYPSLRRAIAEQLRTHMRSRSLRLRPGQHRDQDNQSSENFQLHKVKPFCSLYLYDVQNEEPDSKFCQQLLQNNPLALYNYCGMRAVSARIRQKSLKFAARYPSSYFQFMHMKPWLPLFFRTSPVPTAIRWP